MSLLLRFRSSTFRNPLSLDENPRQCNAMSNQQKRYFVTSLLHAGNTGCDVTLINSCRWWLTTNIFIAMITQNRKEMNLRNPICNSSDAGFIFYEWLDLILWMIIRIIEKQNIKSVEMCFATPSNLSAYKATRTRTAYQCQWKSFSFSSILSGIVVNKPPMFKSMDKKLLK